MSVDTPGSSHELVTRRLPQGVDQLPSGGYRARITVDGRQKTVGTFSNATAAGRAASQARADVARGGWIDPRKAKVTLDDWMALWWPHRKVRPATLEKDQERYRLHISPHLGDVALNQITPYRVTQWIAALDANPPTVKKAHSLLRTALGVRGALGDQRITVNPCTLVKPPSVDPPRWTLLTATQVGALITATADYWTPFVTLAADTGCRWSELVALQRHDFNPLRKELLIRRTLDHKGRIGQTKSGRQRTIPLTPRALDTLNTVSAGLEPDAFLFTAPRGGRISASSFRSRTWISACETAKVTARFHDLRHSCASRLLAGGATLAEVRDYLGHSSVVVTERYLHVDRGSLADVVVKALG